MDRFEIKRLDKEFPLPKYQTPGSVGLDCYVREDKIILSGAWALIPLGIVGKALPGTFIGVLPRSSTFKKTGLLLANSIGVVDQDYCGPEDEIVALVFNPSGERVKVRRGDRLFQLVLFKVETPEVVEVEEVTSESRGGFGSTDEC